jgi:hypothetical protein
MRRILYLILATGLWLSPGSFALGQASHEDPYLMQQGNESKLVQQVRHELLMLPYYSMIWAFA